MNRQIDVRALVSHIVSGDGMDRCRICMGDTTEGQVFLSDTVMLDDDRPITLSELLETVTGVEMRMELLCPEGVCITCVTAAISAQQFMYLTQESKKQWNRTLSALEHIPKNVPNPSKALCAFIKGTDVSIHIFKDYKNKNSNFTIEDLKSRITQDQEVGRIRRKLKAVRSTISSVRSDCPDCGKQFSSPYYLNIHLRNSGQKEACLVCGLVFFRGKEIKEHLVVEHNERVYSCKECPQFFSLELDLKRHQREAHSSNVFSCSDCGRVFPRKSSFEVHSQMHAVRTCRSCGSQFTNRSCYRQHRAMCEPDAKPPRFILPKKKRSNLRDLAVYTCDYCGKTYTSRPQLKNHIIWIHMDVRPHQCQWCGKRFYTSARLAEHTVVHTRVRNFGCDICGAKLVSKMAAIYHRRRHTGEKPYECADCGEKFISSSRRTEHAKRRHGYGKRFACTLCSATFVRTHELRKHVEKTHSMKFKMEDKL